MEKMRKLSLDRGDISLSEKYRKKLGGGTAAACKDNLVMKKRGKENEVEKERKRKRETEIHNDIDREKRREGEIGIQR